MNRIAKALQLIYILSLRDIVSLDELSDALDISRRGVQRLRLDLEEAGYYIETIKGPNGGYRLIRNQMLPSAHLTPSEQKVLKKSISILEQEYTSDFGPELTSALGKLSFSVDDDTFTAVPHFQTVRLNVDKELYREHMMLLEAAIDRHKKVEIIYQKNRREKRNYIFEPYSLLVVNGQWYLAGFDDQNRYLTLKLIRILKLRITESSFRHDDTYLEKVRKYEQGHRIKPVEASILIRDMDYISEYIWGEDQTIEWIDDSVFRLKVTFPNIKALQQFVFRGGSSMYVESPAQVKEWVKEEALKIAKLYS